MKYRHNPSSSAQYEIFQKKNNKICLKNNIFEMLQIFPYGNVTAMKREWRKNTAGRRHSCMQSRVVAACCNYQLRKRIFFHFEC
jgi:hypothetical protein